MNDSEERKKTAPYISFATFQSALDAVANAGVPSIIDRHSFPSFSGGAVAAILSAFRFFDLIDSAQRPSVFLHDLAVNKDDRKKNVKTLLEKHYDTIFEINLERATPPLLDNAFSAARYHVSGATKRKAQAFFLKAVAFAEIPIGKLLSSKSRNSGPRKPRKARPANDTVKITPAGTLAPDQVELVSSTSSAATKIVRLKGGGTIVLTASVDPLSLIGRDREFFYKVVDLLAEYETSSSIEQVLPERQKPDAATSG